MSRRGPAPGLQVDRDVAALIVKVGNYPLHHGGVDAIRSLGRLGVPVYAVSEDRWTPAALSRYCRGHYVWPPEERADPKRMVERLKEAGREIPGPAVLIPTDEEAAVLIAENSAALAEWFLLPRVPASLPARLASKRGLYELCLEHDVPTPASSFPQTAADVAEFAATATFPVVAKNLEAWVRLRVPVVNGTTVIATAAELLALARGWGDKPSVILQEYIPPEHAEDWIVHLYRGAGGEPLVLFTGVKVRSWPPQAGMTACAYTVTNPQLAALAARLCERVGYCGIADLDFRYDRRDGRYKLVDFNPADRRPVPVVRERRRGRRGAGPAPGPDWAPGAAGQLAREPAHPRGERRPDRPAGSQADPAAQWLPGPRAVRAGADRARLARR